jgi:hypothetical protein
MKVQDGRRDQVELMVAHSKTTAVASSEEMAQKIAQSIGIPKGVVVCKKLGVDYRLFGGAEEVNPHQGGEKASNKTSAIRQVSAVRRSRRTKGRCKGPQSRKSGIKAMAASAKKATIGAFATREASRQARNAEGRKKQAIHCRGAACGFARR